MKTYEYIVEQKSVTYNFRIGTTEEEKYIKEKTKYYWRLVNVVLYQNTFDSSCDKMFYYWEREIKENNFDFPPVGHL
jgi:hypothetical protein